MSRRLGVMMALMFLVTSCILRIPAAEAQFTADFIVTDVLGNQNAHKVYIKGDKIRQDFMAGGKLSYSTIRRPDLKMLITLWPEGQYDQDTLPEEQYRLPEETYIEKTLANEKINGYDCTVTQYTYQKKSLGVWTRWYSPQLNFYIKTVKANTNGKPFLTLEYKNIKQEELKNSLFDITPGYTRIPLYPDIPVAYCTGKSAETPFGYIYLLPNDYKVKAGKKWPIILYLHGAGWRGNDLDHLRRDISISLILKHTKGECIILAPQCPPDINFNEIDLLNLIDEFTKSFNVDTKRLYMTGVSMGGFTTWYLAIRAPEYFAAIVPVCGGGDPMRASRLKELPIWAFHGAKDYVVPMGNSMIMVEAVKACGGNVKFTVYPDKDHYLEPVVYDTPELYQWLLQQKKP